MTRVSIEYEKANGECSTLTVDQPDADDPEPEIVRLAFGLLPKAAICHRVDVNGDRAL